MMNLSIAALLFCVFLQPRLWNSNDTFPFGSRETGSGFHTSLSQGQGRINGNSKGHFLYVDDKHENQHLHGHIILIVIKMHQRRRL